MKYERLTDSETAIMLKNTKGLSWSEDDIETQRYIRLAELEDKIENGTLVELPFMRQRKNGQWEIIYIDENGYTSVRAFTNKAEAEKRLEELRGEK